MDKRYEYIALIAEYGSILHASEKLYITASALSKYVQTMEKQLGVKLFDRIGKRFVLTYAGERYLDWMSKINNTHDQMVSELRDLSNSNTGLIRLGVQFSRSQPVIERILPNFYKKYPQVKLEVYEGSANDLREMLEDNQLDFALMPNSVQNSSILTYPLISRTRVLVAPQNHWLSDVAMRKDGFPYPWVDISLCSGERYISSYPTQNSYQPFNELHAVYGITPNIVLQAASLGTIMEAVQQGLGLTVTNDDILLLDKQFSSLRMFCYGNPTTVSEYCIAFQKDRHLTTPVQNLMEMCKSLFTNL